MDSLITAAGRALAAGDPLGALNQVALREDPPALALRGIAMAQLGDLDRAKLLLRRATRGFGAREVVARARCVVAEAEIALASRDLGFSAQTLEAARAALEAHGDRLNAAHARYLEVRRLLLIGRLDEAEQALSNSPRHQWQGFSVSRPGVPASSTCPGQRSPQADPESVSSEVGSGNELAASDAQDKTLDPSLEGALEGRGWRLNSLSPAHLPPALCAVHGLVVAGIAMRRLDTKIARAALSQAENAASQAAIPSLMAEVSSAWRMLNAPAARLIARGEERPLLLDDVEEMQTSQALVVDACRYVVRAGESAISLATRPVLFTLARALGEVWPGDITRDALVARAFRAKVADESHRARLRVEIGRLRAALRAVAGITATQRGFALTPHGSREVLVLARPVEEEYAAVLALLSDGESWSSSALALALGASQRTMQRALDSLAAARKVQWIGRGPARRWMMPPVPGFATTLLLPAPLPGD